MHRIFFSKVEVKDCNVMIDEKTFLIKQQVNKF